jgi:GGDEF domain-containing protein
LASRVTRALGRLTVGDRPLSASVGHAIYPSDGSSPEALLAHADLALCGDKRDGRILERASR